MKPRNPPRDPSHHTSPHASAVAAQGTSPIPSPSAETAYDLVFAGKRVHFIGIGGSGMSGLAQMLRNRGATVMGSDQSWSPLLEQLENLGIHSHVGEPMSVLPSDLDLVVYSAAIKGNHPEMLAASERCIRTLTYAEVLGLAQQQCTSVSIAGTHGKSTTTAMTSWVLLRTGLDPSVIVGATCEQIGGGSRNGSARIPAGPLCGEPGIMVCEACEFNRSFHQHRPQIAVINNVEADHLDCYANLEAIIQSFREFAGLLPSAEAGGRLLIAHEGAHRREVCSDLSCAVATWGFSPSADYQVIYDAKAQRVGILQDGIWMAQWTNQMPGDHNALNSAAAAITAHWLGADWDAIAEALCEFRGLDRRSQLKGVRTLASGGTVRVFDDYAHHPTECEKTLRALRASERPRRLICVFQPHQASRTRHLLSEFASSFSNADIVLVPDIYFSRDSENDKQRVSSSDLVERLRERGTDARHHHPFEAINRELETLCEDGDLVVTMGAGPVYKIAESYLGSELRAPLDWIKNARSA